MSTKAAAAKKASEAAEATSLEDELGVWEPAGVEGGEVLPPALGVGVVGVVGVGVAGVVPEEAAATVTESFMPLEQWKETPQTKLWTPAVLRGMVVAPLFSLDIAFAVLQLL